MENQSLIDILEALVEKYGFPLLEHALGKHKNPDADPIDAITPHLEDMTPHQLNTVMSIANGMMASKAASDTGPGGSTNPPPPKP